MSRFEGSSNNNKEIPRYNRFSRANENSLGNKDYIDVSDDGFWTKKAEIVKTTQNTNDRKFQRLDLSHHIMNSDSTPEQMTRYSVFYRVEEILKQLAENDFSYTRIPQRERSPSPPPTYDEKGNRVNTREMRHKKKLEDEKIKLVQLSLKSLINYTTPDNYIKPNFFKEKFYLPVDEYRNINFIGLLLGPRGTTLKSLQQENGCRIQIRGKGSFQKGKSEEEMPIGSMSEAEPLHCLVIADSEEKLRKGLKGCENVVMRAITAPSGQNDMKREQLKELAKLNGTYRDTESSACQICGNEGHNRFNCPKSEKYLATMECAKCKKLGHLEEDCDVITAKANIYEDLRVEKKEPSLGKRKLVYDEEDELAQKPKITKIENKESHDVKANIKTEVSAEPTKLPVQHVEAEGSPEVVAESVQEEQELEPPALDDSDDNLAPPALDDSEDDIPPPALNDSDDDLAPPPTFDDDSD